MRCIGSTSLLHNRPGTVLFPLYIFISLYFFFPHGRDSRDGLRGTSGILEAAVVGGLAAKGAPMKLNLLRLDCTWAFARWGSMWQQQFYHSGRSNNVFMIAKKKKEMGLGQVSFLFRYNACKT